ncbi:MAG: low specificity L-threonine aldolase [Alphaproteobacteria bacterium]
MNFASDNTGSVAPEIMAALDAVNRGPAMPYGNDATTQRLAQKFKDLFETDLAVFPVATGTAANVLGLSLVTPPYGAIYCLAASHINGDECGAPEFYTGGAKLVTLTGAHGKLLPRELDEAVRRAGNGVVHHVQPAAVSITQASEAGTIYRVAEIEALAEVAQRHKLALHMDGARFGNAVAALNCKPADVTWRAGVDILSFGATKNGAMAAEAVVVFKPELAVTLGFRRKRAGHLFSKMRYLSAQLDAYVTDGLWLRLAGHANGAMRTLADGLVGIDGVRLLYPADANMLFAELPRRCIAALKKAGFVFYEIDDTGPNGILVRLVTSFNTDPAHVAAFVGTARDAR